MHTRRLALHSRSIVTLSCASCLPHTSTVSCTRALVRVKRRAEIQPPDLDLDPDFDLNLSTRQVHLITTTITTIQTLHISEDTVINLVVAAKVRGRGVVVLVFVFVFVLVS